VYPKAFQDLIKIGEDFHLKIQFQENPSEILVAINEAKHIFISQGQFAPANKYKVRNFLNIINTKI
jgi:hypothetical protein